MKRTQNKTSKLFNYLASNILGINFIISFVFRLYFVQNKLTSRRKVTQNCEQRTVTEEDDFKQRVDTTLRTGWI